MDYGFTLEFEDKVYGWLLPRLIEDKDNGKTMTMIVIVIVTVT